MQYETILAGVIGTTRHTHMIRVLLTIVVALTLAAAAPVGWADNDDDEEDDEIPFAEAHIFFELNNTDGDLGIHALIDGEPWKKLQIFDPRDRRMLNIRVNGRLRRQGLTEIFFESAEPPFDELAPAKFFRRFPAGEYEIEGETLDGHELESPTGITHVMPAPADGIRLNDAPVNLELVDCDDEGTIPVVTGRTVTVSWAEVMMSHPDPEGGGAGVQPPIPVTINNYQVVVEVEVNDFASVLSVILPPGRTSMTIPAEFIAQGKEFKYEILAREESFNQTAVESCFVM